MIPRAHMKKAKPGMVAQACNPAARDADRKLPQGQPASLDCLLRTWQMRYPVSKNKVESVLEERYLSLTCGLQVCLHTFTHPHRNTPHPHPTRIRLK